jgi:hypothetical protein
MSWVRSSTTAGQQFITAFNTNSGGNKLLLGHPAGNNELQLFDTTGGQDTNTIIVDGNWHLVGYIFEDSSNNVRLYVDGVNIYNYSTTTTVAGNDRFVIGLEYDNSNPGDYWDGDIDEFAVWNKTFTSNQIKDMYYRGLAKVNVSVRSCDDFACVGDSWEESFIGLYHDLSINDDTYFQYKVNISTETSSISPKFDKVEIGNSVSSDVDPTVTYYPENNSEIYSSSLYINLSSDIDLIYVGVYLNGNKSETIDLNQITAKVWENEITNLEDGKYNLTYIYNTSYRQYNFTINLTYTKLSNVEVIKELNSISSDVYSVNLTIINKVNGSKNIILTDFVPDNFNVGSFTPSFDFTNQTSSGKYNGDVYAWNLTLSPNSINQISYAIIGIGDYELLKAYPVGVGD